MLIAANSGWGGGIPNGITGNMGGGGGIPGRGRWGCTPVPLRCCSCSRNLSSNLICSLWCSSSSIGEGLVIKWNGRDRVIIKCSNPVIKSLTNVHINVFGCTGRMYNNSGCGLTLPKHGRVLVIMELACLILQ